MTLIATTPSRSGPSLIGKDGKLFPVPETTEGENLDFTTIDDNYKYASEAEAQDSSSDFSEVNFIDDSGRQWQR